MGPDGVHETQLNLYELRAGSAVEHRVKPPTICTRAFESYRDQEQDSRKFSKMHDAILSHPVLESPPRTRSLPRNGRFSRSRDAARRRN